MFRDGPKSIARSINSVDSLLCQVTAIVVKYGVIIKYDMYCRVKDRNAAHPERHLRLDSGRTHCECPFAHHLELKNSLPQGRTKAESAKAL